MADRDDDMLAVAAAALRIAPVPSPDPLVVAAAALREVPAAAPGDVATTRVRVMASLERRGHGRRRRVVVAAVLATIGTGTLSWAAATGRVERVLAAIARPAPAVVDPAAAPAPAVATAPKHRAHRAADAVAPDALAPTDPAPVAQQASTAPTLIPVPDAPATAVPIEPIVTPAPVHRAVHRRAEPAPVDDAVDRELYQRAHAAHFRGADAGTALAAWDAYLAERPAGRFAIEARYNRALVLIKLDRRAEARDALAPFAAGAVAPAGYRQRDAQALIDALDRAAPESP